MFGEMCSFGLMRELGIDADSVRRCAWAVIMFEPL